MPEFSMILLNHIMLFKIIEQVQMTTSVLKQFSQTQNYYVFFT